MRSLYKTLESLLNSDTDIKARGERDVFLTEIVHELRMNFDIDRTAYPNSTGNSELPFAKIHNFHRYQYKQALDKFKDHLEAIKIILKHKGIKTEVIVHRNDHIFSYTILTAEDYEIKFTKIRKPNVKLDLDITLMFSGEYKTGQDTILKLEYINMSSPDAEIKELLK